MIPSRAGVEQLVALHAVAPAAGDGEPYHAVLFGLAAIDDDRAWACLRAWLDAWRAANACSTSVVSPECRPADRLQETPGLGQPGRRLARVVSPVSRALVRVARDAE